MAFPVLLLTFIVVPITEIWLLLRISNSIGGGITLLIVISTAILGAYLVREQGLATLQSMQTQMNAGQIPAMEMAEGFALLLAGVVLLTPGFMTDALGFALLIPPLRQALIRWVGSQRQIKMQTSTAGFHSKTHSTPQTRQNNSRSSTIIEGEYSDGE